MILWPAPSTRAQPARAEPLAVQSIKQPQLDLHSRLHNPGTYRVKAPGRSPLTRPGRKEQADDPHHGAPPIQRRRPRRAIQRQTALTPNRRRQPVEHDEYGSFTRRVIRAYAAAWHVPDDKVDFWMWGYENMNTSITRQLWLKIRRFVLSARWSDEAKGET